MTSRELQQHLMPLAALVLTTLSKKSHRRHDPVPAEGSALQGNAAPPASMK
jgi:hypothetical protein